MTDEKRLAMLKWRDGIVDLVLDTDAATEVDDPFAIAYLLLSPERFRLQAIYAAPFAMNERTQDPAEGMEMSYEEILHIMRLCHKDQACPVYRGAKKWLTEKTEEEIVQIRSGRVWSGSEAAEDLIRRSKKYTSENPLYVLGIGAGTNLALALLKDPSIVERIVIIWLAGDDFQNSPNVYNVYQDRRAAQIILNSGVPLVYVPCNYVTSHMITSVPELEACIGGKNELCNYLIKIVREYGADLFAWGKTIWDLGAAGILYKKEWSQWEVRSVPMITEQLTFSFGADRPLIACVRSLDRDEIFRDAFWKFGKVK